ncbi:MAG: ParB/RepB/Spo0J family partition protein [Dehalococcoidales bacterium]|nr:ParB/RepB/Spo0J family partition protein [Dehalococcoidales bacterium]
MVTETKVQTEVQTKTILLDIERIRPNPYQPESRLEVDEETAKKFGLSILEHGLLQTPIARQVTKFIPRQTDIVYEMGDGWLRRSGFAWLARNGHPEYGRMPLEVRELTDKQMADLVLEANSVRKDLTPIDRAKFFKRYLEDFKITQAELARAHNCSQGEIANTIRLLELPEDIQGKIISQEISETHGRQLLRLNYKPELQSKVLAESIRQGYSINQLSNQIQSEIYRDSENLDPNDYPKPEIDVAGCEKCPSRQKIGSPYSSDKKTWRCLDKDCYQKKKAAESQARVDAMKAEIAAAKKDAGDKTKSGGMLDLSKLTWRDYQELDSSAHEIDMTECRNCSRRAIGKDWRDRPLKVCIDVKCFKAKEKVHQDKEAAKAREAEKQLTERVKAACDNLKDESTAFRIIIDYLVGHSRKDTRERVARMCGLKENELANKLANDAEDRVITMTLALVVQKERYEGEKGVFQKMLADLEGTSAELDKALDAHRAKHCKGCSNDNDNRTCRHLLQRHGEGWKDKCYHYSKAATGEDDEEFGEDDEE